MNQNFQRKFASQVQVIRIKTVIFLYALVQAEKTKVKILCVN